MGDLEARLVVVVGQMERRRLECLTPGTRGQNKSLSDVVEEEVAHELERGVVVWADRLGWNALTCDGFNPSTERFRRLSVDGQRVGLPLSRERHRLRDDAVGHARRHPNYHGAPRRTCRPSDRTASAHSVTGDAMAVVIEVPGIAPPLRADDLHKPSNLRGPYRHRVFLAYQRRGLPIPPP